MNRRLLDQFQVLALPELLEDSLEEGSTQCIAFNRRGTLLAAGLQDGRVIIWDFETRGVARSIQTHSAGITSLAWSKDGRLLVFATVEGYAILWNIEKNVQEGEMNLGQHILHVSMNQKDPRLCLVSFPNIGPSLLDFREERSHTLPCLQIATPDADNKGTRPSSSGLQEGVTAIFSKSGELVYVTLAKGFVAVLERSNLRFVDLIKVPGSARAANLALSRNGKHLLVIYTDKVIRAFAVPDGGAGDSRSFSLPELRSHLASLEIPTAGSILRPQQPLLKLETHTFQNAVDKNNWQCAAFTSDAEHVAAASANKDVHHIHIWTRWGRLERILQGPNFGVRDMAWHSTRSLLATVSCSGAIYLWARVYRENWSAFAPDFRELQENEEYIEPEDVFDINPKPQAGVTGDGNTNGTDVEVDILTENQVQLDSSDDEGGTDYFDHLPVNIVPQNFDEKGQLIKTDDQVQESPAPSSIIDSEPAISDGADSPRNSALPEKNTGSEAEESGTRLRPGRLKRYVDEDLEDDQFEDELVMSKTARFVY